MVCDTTFYVSAFLLMDLEGASQISYSELCCLNIGMYASLQYDVSNSLGRIPRKEPAGQMDF